MQAPIFDYTFPDNFRVQWFMLAKGEGMPGNYNHEKHFSGPALVVRQNSTHGHHSIEFNATDPHALAKLAEGIERRVELEVQEAARTFDIERKQHAAEKRELLDALEACVRDLAPKSKDIKRPEVFTFNVARATITKFTTR